MKDEIGLNLLRKLPVLRGSAVNSRLSPMQSTNPPAIPLIR